MKLIVGVILTLALLEVSLCAPLIGSDDGKFKETNTSSSWGYGVGADANVSVLEYKDGALSVGPKTHFGANIEGHKENGQKDLVYAVTAAPPPNNFGSGFISPYGMPNSPANGLPYYIQYAPQVLPPFQGVPQFALQPITPYAPQLPQVGSQYTQQLPQYASQQTPQVAPQYAPQYAPQAAPQYAPQYVPQNAPQYAPRVAPQYAPQGAPQYAL